MVESMAERRLQVGMNSFGDVASDDGRVLSRFDLKYDRRHLLRQAREVSVRLFGERVGPRVRELLDHGDDT